MTEKIFVVNENFFKKFVRDEKSKSETELLVSIQVRVNNPKTRYYRKFLQYSNEHLNLVYLLLYYKRNEALIYSITVNTLDISCYSRDFSWGARINTFTEVVKEGRKKKRRGRRRGSLNALVFSLAFVRNFRVGRKFEECRPKALILHNT